MGKIPTAEEFLKQSKNIDYSTIEGSNPQLSVLPFIEADLIEFAKLHVEAALKEALESIPCLGSSSDIASYEEVEEAVLTAYPSKNIK